MSKESKLRDLHRQSIEAIRDRLPFCRGCGTTTDEHRPDCTVSPSPLLCAGPDCDEMRLPSEKRPIWQFNPATSEYFCPPHFRR